MADYISRDTAIEAAKHAWAKGLEPSQYLEIIPAADVEPVRHGRWEGYTLSCFYGCDEDGEPIFRDRTVWYCSNRKCRKKTVIKEKFCPGCGAKMDLEVCENDS